MWDKAAVIANYLLVLVGIVGTIVAICTLRKIERQTKAGEDAAKAALLQANHVVISERAWMVAVPENPNPPIPEGSEYSAAMAPLVTTIPIKFFNKGKTPAFILKIASGGCALPRGEMPDLTDTPEWDELDSAPFVPEHFCSWEQPRIVVERAIKLRTGELYLWVYGKIQYRDSFGEQHDTEFCFRFIPVNEYGGSEWLIAGPKGANNAT